MKRSESEKRSGNEIESENKSESERGTGFNSKNLQ